MDAARRFRVDFSCNANIEAKQSHRLNIKLPNVSFETGPRSELENENVDISTMGPTHLRIWVRVIQVLLWIERLSDDYI